VGLVQRVIEEAKVSTITLSPIWRFTASVGAPRVAAIAYPSGLGFGAPGDAAGQRAVLQATLDALVEIQEPGEVVHLPFEWQRIKGLSLKPSPLPPIARLCIKKPWLLKRLAAGPLSSPL
jgi:D-proline reductase (dithiol) PrdB